MSEQPFMQLYVADYLGDTRHLTTEQHGAYLLLLMTMWRHGGRLPNDASKLARIAGVTMRRWHVVAAEVMPFFTVDGDSITQKRLAEEYQKASSKSEKRSACGKLGGDVNALKIKRTAQAKASHLPKHSSEARNQIPEDSSESTELDDNDVGADAPPPTLPEAIPLYAFQATCIRLTQRHLDAWRQAFPHIPLEARLWALDDWAHQQGKNWFHAVAARLGKEEAAALATLDVKRLELAQPRAKRHQDGRI